MIDKKKFDQIFKENYADLCKFTYTFIQDKSITEDVVQEIFVKFWNKRKSIHHLSNIKSYLLTSAKYASIDYLRKNINSKYINIEDAQHELEPIESEFLKHDIDEIKQEINNAIDQLPAKCRAIFLLSREAKLTYSEISEELDISRKTVENQISIAIKKIRDQMKTKDLICLLYFIYTI
jgi:RNA polymerase sigma-70 factor (ECF subfamily)